ncbi:hypothetical protein DEI81_15665 [Curtobacterium sp. MCBD17_013]|uniref:septum formation family protein n=1 Tax=Curtobacterium sp. MCBD17_013 TaxID=2175668 RepID=UPI000DA9D616|nr:septum formation family protein [Curtobacterium sp. MCBD17_013]PZF56933.1 hypothetical protein DEI81_15665 [Curtobacterium sp. MCBD17_013]
MSHPSSLQLPTARSTRDQRAEEIRAIDEERRRVDPHGTGREDVDWLGRATGVAPSLPSERDDVIPPAAAPTEPPVAGVRARLPRGEERPSFTDLLRLPGDEAAGAGTSDHDSRFDWAALGGADDEGTNADRDADAGDADGADRADRAGDVDAEASRAAVVDGPAAALAASAAPVPAAAVPAPAAGSRPTRWSLSDDDAGSDAAEAGSAQSAHSEVTAAIPAQHDAPEGVPAGSDTADPVVDTADAAERDTDDSGVDTPTAALPWWAQPETGPAVVPESPSRAADPLPPTAAPPLVSPVDPAHPEQVYPAHLPPAVGQDLDALLGTDRSAHVPDDGRPRPERQPETIAWAPETGPADVVETGPADVVDQTEWDGRETSDTRAINALFGTGALRAVDGVEDDAALGDDHADSAAGRAGDTGTRMMPVVGAPGAPPTGAPGAAPAGAGPSAGSVLPGQSARGAVPVGRRDGRGDNLLNEGFGRLAAQGRRGKQLLVYGAIAIIIVLLVLVFLVVRWILGGDPQNQPAPAPSSTSSSKPSRSPAAASTRSTSSTPAPAPSATAVFATTAASVGQHSWRDLAGGECLSPYENAWAQIFTVVDCSAAHAAQMTFRGTLTQSSYPGPDALRGQMTELCSATSAIDLGAAAAYTDLQVQGAYPADESEWNAGDRYYYCFASRSSGQPLTSSLAPSA